jgi:hypothetical protein
LPVEVFGMAELTEYEIVDLMGEDDPDAEPICIVEATGKKQAMRAAAKGLGGEVSDTKTYQQNRPILWLKDEDGGPMMCVARRRRQRGRES